MEKWKTNQVLIQPSLGSLEDNRDARNRYSIPESGKMLAFRLELYAVLVQENFMNWKTACLNHTRRQVFIIDRKD